MTDHLLYALLPIALISCISICVICLVTGKRKFDLKIRALGVRIELKSNATLTNEEEENELAN